MYHKKKKRRLKKFLIFFAIIGILWISFGLFLNLRNNTQKQLESLGYSNIEISIIEDMLNKKQIKKISKYSYMSYLTELLSNKDMNINNLEKYLSYYTEYPIINISDLVYIVNNNLTNIPYNDFTKEIIYHEDFKQDKITRYSEYYNKFKLSINNTVFAVNNDLDKYNIKYNDNYKIFMKDSLCIKSNLPRYDNYYQNNKNISIKETITKVNNNLDLEPYTNSKEADINKGAQILVNRYYHLTKNYIPNDLVDMETKYGNGRINKDAYVAFKQMYEDAKKSDISIYIITGYVSYDEQEILYYKNKYSNEKPGYSESQTGLSLKITNSDWLNQNAYKYGFILRYPKEYEELTGYYKPNYYRYVGKDIALFLQNNQMTYDEYYAYFINQK